MSEPVRKRNSDEFGAEYADDSDYCDSCVHATWEHSKETGACQRINPIYGPCPCDHTSQAEWQAQRVVFLASKGQRDSEGRTNN